MACNLAVSIKQNSQDIASNRSNVTVKITVTVTGGAYNHAGTSYGVIKWGGLWSSSSDTTFYHSFDSSSTTTVYSWTGNVTHNPDGTGSLSASCSFRTGTSYGTISASKSLTLTTIPRASQPTVGGTFQLGSAITVYTNRKSSSFTHTLTWSWAGKSGTVATGVGASYAWTPPVATFAPYLTGAAAATCTIACTTYSGSTAVGSKTTSFSLAIPASVVPSISSVSVTDSTGLLAAYGSLVQNQSVAVASVSASGSFGSTIKAYSVSLDSLKGSSATSTLGKPYSPGTRTVSVTVTDTRGRTASKSASVTVAPWSPPAFSSVSAMRWANGAEDDESTTVRVAFGASITDIAGKGTNSPSATVRWREAGSPSWSSKAVAVEGLSFSGVLDIDGIDTAKEYEVYIGVSDSLATTGRTFAIGTARPLMDFAAGGRGMGIGSVAPADGLKVGMRAEFLDCLDVDDDPVGKSWHNSRDAVSMGRKAKPKADGSFYPAFGFATANGSWECGSLGNGEALYFSYVKDSDYSSGNNTSFKMQVDPTQTAPMKALSVGGKTLLDAVYPVGAVYVSYVSTSPASLFGGSWTQITGRFLRAANDVSTGGSDTHTHAGRGSLIARVAINTDKYLYYNYVMGNGAWTPNYWIGGSGVAVGSSGISYQPNSGAMVEGSTGNNTANPAFQDLYVWRRTA